MIERPAGVSNGFFGSHPPALMDPAAVDLVDAFLFANPGGRERLIPLLQCVQDELGHLPMEAQELVADRLAMSPTQRARLGVQEALAAKTLGRGRLRRRRP